MNRTAMRFLACTMLWGACGGAQAAQSEALPILSGAGVTGGLIVHLGCGDGTLTAALHAGPRYLVHGLDADAKNIAAARKHFQALGLDGRVSAEQWRGARLPYLDNLVNLLVAEDLHGTSTAEVMRVLAPGGVACIKSGGQWTKTVKPWPEEIDQWTHYLHDPSNNAVAHDRVVGPPRGLQWFAGPLYCRSHETDSSISAMVSAAGRLFYILDEGPIGVADKRLPQTWALRACDAFNGVPLWEVPLPEWGWPEWKKAELTAADWTAIKGNRLRSPTVLPRRLVTDGSHVYVTLGFHAPVTVLDAVTGATLRTCAGSEETDEILCSGQKLVVCIRPQRVGDQPSAEDSGKGKKHNRKVPRRAGKGNEPPPATDRIAAIEAGSGRMLWQVSPGSVVQLSLAVDDGRVFFHDGRNIVCLDLENGAERWQSPSLASGGRLFSSSDTLIACHGVVLTNSDSLDAFDAASGKKLWSGKSAKGPGISNAPDLFLTAGLVWDGNDLHGRDPRTGEVKRTLDLQKLINPWHHYRCYRSKATDRYLIWPKQGAEFIDLEGSDNMRHDWFRGPCKYGIMPCNGMIYSGPHQCSCFAGVKLNGFNALSPRSSAPATAAPAESRLEKGPAYECTANPQSPIPNPAHSDWPSFRGNHQRSGSNSSAVPAALATRWEAALSGKLSQPVVADGKLFVAAVDAQRIACLDADNGRLLWSFAAGGRIDSPPTIHNGLALFGSADGWVYAVRASDGVLSWRFRAAPDERRLVAMGQVESVWPVHGSALVQNGVAYVVAGRSSYLDGGLFLSALDPATGRLLHEGRFEGPYPDVKTDDGGSRDMPGARSDVLVGDGQAVYLRQLKFDANLKQLGAWSNGTYGNAAIGMRVMSTSDLLDDSEFNRTCWHYGPQWSSSQGGGISGQILVFDHTTTYAAQIYSKHVAQSMVYFPGENYVQLFAHQNGTTQPEQLVTTTKRRAKRAGDDRWSETIPIFVRAMALAGKTLFVAGLPDSLDPANPLAILEGQRGGVLWAFSAADGKKLSSIKLDAPPVFDGVAVAGERLYVSLADGRLLCMGGKQ